MAAAQDGFRNSVEAGGGAGIPVFSRSRSIWDDSPQLSAGYGFRFQRHLQADILYTHVFNPAQSQFDQFGFSEGHNPGGGTIHSVLFGGRALFRTGARVRLSAGAGAIYDRFSAPRLSFPAELDQTGWGAYALVSASMPLVRSERFYVAVTPRLELVQAWQSWLHRHRWVTVPVQFGVRF